MKNTQHDMVAVFIVLVLPTPFLHSPLLHSYLLQLRVSDTFLMNLSKQDFI
jgi:hypothetical protein